VTTVYKLAKLAAALLTAPLLWALFSWMPESVQSGALALLEWNPIDLLSGHESWLVVILLLVVQVAWYLLVVVLGVVLVVWYGILPVYAAVAVAAYFFFPTVWQKLT